MVTYLLGKKLMKNSLILTRPFLINRFQVKILMNFYYNTLFPCQWLVRNGDKIGGCHFLDEKDFFFFFFGSVVGGCFLGKNCESKGEIRV